MLSFLWELLDTLFFTGTDFPKGENRKSPHHWVVWVGALIFATLVGMALNLLWP